MNDQTPNGGPLNDLVDPQLTRLYREVAREEPPAGLDAAILAAARREAGARPHKLGSQTGPEPASMPGSAPRFRPASILPRMWRLPVSLAAVMVLSVSVVTLIREHDGERQPQPLPKLPPPAAEETRTPESSSAAPVPSAPSKKALQDRRGAVEPEPAYRRKALEQPDTARGAAPAAADPRGGNAASDRVHAFSAPPAQQFAAPRAEARSAVTSSMSKLAAEYAHEPPEKWGERILDLRRQGRSAEADNLLAEFSRRFPDYAVPEAWTR